MLNEKSGIWIKLYKLCIIIIFILCFPGCFFLGTFTEAYRLFLLLLYLFRPIRRNPSMDFEYADLKSCFQSPNSS